jgi:hypothetical protein
VTELRENSLDLIGYHVDRIEEYSRAAPLTDLVWAYVQALDNERPGMTEQEVLRDALAFAIALLKRMGGIEARASSARQNHTKALTF